MSKFFIQVRDQFGGWKPYATKHNEKDAFRVASRRATQNGTQHRIVDEDGRLIDLITP
tara:strand:- start:333 stop:506 length:174 start_codon:yes stop_codon:yes gene_type:complete